MRAAREVSQLCRAPRPRSPANYILPAVRVERFERSLPCALSRFAFNDGRATFAESPMASPAQEREESQNNFFRYFQAR